MIGSLSLSGRVQLGHRGTAIDDRKLLGIIRKLSKIISGHKLAVEKR